MIARKHYSTFLLFVGFALTILFGGWLISGQAYAKDGDPVNCLMQPPYNCYSIGDIDPKVADSSDYDALTEAYAMLAWQDFLALNFPAEMSNNVPIPTPSTTEGLDTNDGEYVAVWQTYSQARELFLPDGAVPADFGTPHMMPKVCEKAFEENRHRHSANGNNIMVLSHFAKTGPVNNNPNVLDEYIEANRMGPVVDQKGQYLRYGINFNKPIYNYLITNKLYNAAGQEAFDHDDPNRDKVLVEWPQGNYTSTVMESSIGSIMLKSSWMILDDNAPNASSFFRGGALIYDAPGGAFSDVPPVVEKCEYKMVGLVGLHIVHRTNSIPQWVWATFEHGDNAPWYHDFKSPTLPQKAYSLFDPAKCPIESSKPGCAYNQLPSHPWNPQRDDLTPSQIIRIAAPGKSALKVNSEMQDALMKRFGAGKTVWENYFLVDVQFSTLGMRNQGKTQVNPAYPSGFPTPSFLANSTMETYIQGFTDGDVTSNGKLILADDQMITMPDSSTRVDPWDENAAWNRSGGSARLTSSCVGCHGDATLTTGGFGNYLFSLSRATGPEQSGKLTPRDRAARRIIDFLNETTPKQ